MTTTEIQGMLRAEGEHAVARFERTYDTDAADLWRALTEPARLTRWFARVEGDLRLGGEFLIVFDDADASQRTTGSILECEPRSRLVVSWRFEGEPDSGVSVDLAPTGDQTRLVLEHVRLPSKSAAGYGAGWHAYLEQLAASLRGESGHGGRWDARWAELLPVYQAQLEA